MSTLPVEQLYALESENWTDIPDKAIADTKPRRAISGKDILDRLPGIAPHIHLREDRQSTYESVHEIEHSTFPVQAKAPSRDYFIPLQEWEGVVLRVGRDSFQARLADLTEESADEEADFLLDDVSDEDKKLVAPGAVFYWCIGYRVRRGQRSRTSEIRFRRLPAWSEAEIEAARRKAEDFHRSISWE